MGELTEQEIDTFVEKMLTLIKAAMFDLNSTLSIRLKSHEKEEYNKRTTYERMRVNVSGYVDNLRYTKTFAVYFGLYATDIMVDAPEQRRMAQLFADEFVTGWENEVFKLVHGRKDKD